MTRAFFLMPLFLLVFACRLPSEAEPSSRAATGASCVLPERLRLPRPEIPPADQIVPDADVAYHMLAIAWGPQWAETNRDGQGHALTLQDRDVGYFLHGLWPNAAEGDHPRYCSVMPARAMTEAEVREHFCMIPSEALLQHEWAAHGTCGWDDPDAYFDQAGELWADLILPEPDSRTTTGAVRDAWTRANPHLRRGGIYLATTADGRLREVRLCYDLTYAPMDCPRGVGAPDSARMRVRPR